MHRIVIIDYGMGNLGSIMNMLRKVGATAELSVSADDISKADKLILPGVGAFDNAMKNLYDLGYIDVLTQKVIDERTPILGICLGMQLFGLKSEEGHKSGLGWLDAKTVLFQFDGTTGNLKVPHMGWNAVNICRKSPFFPKPDEEHCFYFVHSFHLQCNNPSDVLTYTHYGCEFTSSVCHKNILGTQFHPEKSHRYGLAFLHAFAAWTPATETKW